MGVEEYEDLLEILAEEQDEGFRKAIAEAAAQIQRGEVTSLEGLRAIYRRR